MFGKDFFQPKTVSIEAHKVRIFYQKMEIRFTPNKCKNKGTDVCFDIFWYFPLINSHYGKIHVIVDKCFKLEKHFGLPNRQPGIYD